MKEKIYPKVSIVTLAFDNLEYLVRSVETLYFNNDYPNFELIVVHNPCDDKDINLAIREQCEIWRLNLDKFNYRLNEKNLFHGKGCMEGIFYSHLDTKYICLTNDDIFVAASVSNWLSELSSFLEENTQVATVTPALYHANETIYWIGRTKNKGHHDFLHAPKGDSRLPTGVIYTSYNNFAICLIKKDLLDEFPLGKFCPHYGSDESFCTQVTEKYGMKHCVLPWVKCYHFNIFNKRINYGKEKVIDG